MIYEAAATKASNAMRDESESGVRCADGHEAGCVCCCFQLQRSAQYSVCAAQSDFQRNSSTEVTPLTPTRQHPEVRALNAEAPSALNPHRLVLAGADF